MNMNPESIFYWTGAICWIAVCVGFSATVIVSCLVAPFFALKRIKLLMWQWKYADEVVATGFSQQELQYAMANGKSLPEGYELPTMMAWVESVKTKKPIRAKHEISS